MGNACASSVGIQPTTIEGVMLYPLRQIATEGGPVLHMLKAENPLFKGFGEIYFSEVEAGAVKAWKRHTKQNQLFAVPYGIMEIVVYDAREESSTAGTLLRVTLGRPHNYNLLSMPCGVWYGFTALHGASALLANFADIPHDPTESEKLPANTPKIPFQFL